MPNTKPNLVRGGLVISLIVALTASCGTVETFQDAGIDAVVIDAPDVPGIDAPDVPGIDAPVIDAPVIDAPVIDAPVIDAAVDAPTDAPADAPVDATPTHTLAVTRAGNGTGTVTSSPAGINCGTTCSHAFALNTVVTLTAVATATPLANLSTFTGWSGGGCSGTGTCVVTMSAATAVTATFSLQPNLAFVTSTANHTGNLGGLAGADAICNARAQAVNLPGTYRAWLSSSTVNAIDRFIGVSGWVRVDGKPFVNSVTDLANQRLFTPLRITERNSDVGSGPAHTATTSNGTRHVNSTTCNDYTTALATDALVGGATDGQGSMWTVVGISSCANQARLYCLGVDRAATVVPVAPAGGYRRAFTSGTAFVSGGGLPAADTLCNNEASAAGLPGTYRALLATTTASAASRFNSAAGTLPWGRPDGVLCAPTAAEFFSLALLDSAPNATANLGSYTGNNGNWGGATSVNVPGNVDLTCVNWTGTGSGGSGGRSGSTSQTSRFAGDINGCAATFVRVTCLQQ